MKIALKNSPKNSLAKKTSAAHVIDGKLILSYPDALNPVVWQMDLAQAKSSALEVRENAKGQFILTLKTIMGEAADIVPFATKAEAVDALMDIARALEGAQGQIRPVNANEIPGAAPAAARPGKANRWMAAILGLLLLFILINIWGSLIPRPPAGMENPAQTPSSPTAGFGGSNEPGVPLSADEFLMKNR